MALEEDIVKKFPLLAITGPESSDPEPLSPRKLAIEPVIYDDEEVTYPTTPYTHTNEILVASDAYRALPPNAIITNPPAKATRIIYPDGVKKTFIWHPPPGTPQLIMSINELEDLSSYDPYKPQPNVVKAQIASVTLNLPFSKLEPVPIDERVLPPMDTQEHKLYNHLRMCKESTKQHTMPPSLWIGESSKINIVLDRICPRLPPIDNNKLKGKKVCLASMPAPSRMGIRSYPNMTHKKYHKSLYAREYTEADAEQYYQHWMFECTKGASSFGLTPKEKRHILVIKGKTKTKTSHLCYFSDISVAFVRTNLCPILGSETGILYAICGALLHLEANKEELKEVTDTWLKTPVSWPSVPADGCRKPPLKVITKILSLKVQTEHEFSLTDDRDRLGPYNGGTLGAFDQIMEESSDMHRQSKKVDILRYRVERIKHICTLMSHEARIGFEKSYGRVLDLLKIFVDPAFIRPKSAGVYTYRGAHIAVDKVANLIKLPSHQSALIGNGNIRGWKLKMLEDHLSSVADKDDWSAFNKTLALIMFGTTLFPFHADTVDHAAMDAFFAWDVHLRSLVPTILADTLLSVDFCHQKQGKMLRCCSTPLYV
ncbi:hypothetical protein Fmac_032639 [Flemingia macrophylla]|uniref:DUF7745 domain-containing protein n=1 Tax=Flemingia macrophylla TaxID=520843 RepID=A0ABD1L5G5_9FABA